MVVLIPTERFNESNWIEYYLNHCFMIKNAKPCTLLLGDSIVAGLSRYPNVWNEYFAPINALNLGIGRDRVNMFFGEPSIYLYHHPWKMLLFYAEPIISQLMLTVI